MKKIWKGLTFRLCFIVGMIGLFIVGLVDRDSVIKTFIEIGDELKKQGVK